VTSAGGVGTEHEQVVADVTLVSEISGNTGMKMLGPYGYTPPIYWYKDTRFGGAYGFNTETSPGANIPPLSSLQKMIPKEKLWPMDKEVWEYHSGRNAFKTLDRYINAIDKRYGNGKNIEDFALKCQIMNYELMRPQFEAFIANKPISTGLVQWMLNSA
jgi:exo-1,4-beta-D-glucosaminidase